MSVLKYLPLFLLSCFLKTSSCLLTPRILIIYTMFHSTPIQTSSYHQMSRFVSDASLTCSGGIVWIYCASTRVCVFQSAHLSRLDMCNVPVVDFPAQALSKALLTSRLTVLHLDNAQLSGMPLYTLGMILTNKHQHAHKKYFLPELFWASASECSVTVAIVLSSVCIYKVKDFNY